MIDAVTITLYFLAAMVLIGVVAYLIQHFKTSSAAPTTQINIPSILHPDRLGETRGRATQLVPGGFVSFEWNNIPPERGSLI